MKNGYPKIQMCASEIKVNIPQGSDDEVKNYFKNCFDKNIHDPKLSEVTMNFLLGMSSIKNTAIKI